MFDGVTAGLMALFSPPRITPRAERTNPFTASGAGRRGEKMPPRPLAPFLHGNTALPRALSTHSPQESPCTA